MKLTLAVTGTLFLLVAVLFLNLGRWLSAPATEPIQADLIVTLGGGIGERDQMAVALYQAGYAKKILLTGMGGIVDSSRGVYRSPRSLFMLKQGVPVDALLFDGLAANTHQEAATIAALLTLHHWRSALVVSDPPHIRRINYCLQPVCFFCND